MTERHLCEPMRNLSLELIDSGFPIETAGRVRRPGYCPGSLGAGIVHMGIGNFHRAHQAVYVDDLLAKAGGDWRITAVSLRSPAMRDRLQPQDCLYTLCERGVNGERLRVIGSVESVLVAPENPAAVVEALARDSTYVVTVTVTEKGYCLAPGGRELDLTHPDVASDITGCGAPRTLLGFLLRACRLRKDRGLGGFNILGCDNLPDNAGLLKSCLLTAARLQDSRLANWIEGNLGFCSTMVDRMVPATGTRVAEGIQSRAGYRDSACLLSETFRQWIIEDRFVTRCPDWSSVGALVVKDVAPYERMKLRLLNGSHSALAYLGILLGHSCIHQAVADLRLRLFMVALMHGELMPTLRGLENVDLSAYCEQLLTRFANHAVPYSCLQVASDGSQKLAQRLLQPAAELNARGISCPRICTVIAAWLALLYKSVDAETGFEIDDAGAGKLRAMLRKLGKAENFPDGDHVEALLIHSGIVPPGLLEGGDFVGGVTRAFRHLLTREPGAALANLILAEGAGA